MSDIRRVPTASHWGAFTAVVRDGRLVEAIPREGDPYPSDMVRTMPDAVHNRARVARPSVRRSWLGNAPDRGRERRGAEDFVTVPWDEALDMVAAELARVRREHGHESIFGGSYGWSSAGRFHHAKSQLHRFLNVGGGFTTQVQNYSYAAAITILPHILGSIDAVQGPVSSWDGILQNCRLMVCFGGLPRINMQIEAGGMGAHEGRDWLQKILDAGIRVVCITPSKEDVPDGAEWLTIRPNTDTAAMLAMIHVLLGDGTVDHEFLARCTVGADQVIAYVEGRADGVPKTPDWAAAITGLDADTIRALARGLGRERSFINASWSLQRADRGEQAYWAAIALACMAGHVGLPGGGFALGLASLGNMGVPRRGMASPRLPMGLNLGAQLFWQFETFPEIRKRAKTIVTYPQYWVFRLCGKAVNEVTSLGCHTDLWNPDAKTFSSMVETAGWRDLMAPVAKAADCLGLILPDIAASTGIAPGTKIYCGIHDSNASLYAHLAMRAVPFSIVSTGTWVISMALGGAKVALDPGRDTLVNVNARGEPVPSARFMGGREFDRMMAGLPHEYDQGDIEAVLDRGAMLLPAIEMRSGPFQNRRHSWTVDETSLGPGARFVAVSFYLALMTATGLAMAGADGPVFVEGPFAANQVYLDMLAAATGRPVSAVAGTGTSIGAAMLAAGDSMQARPPVGAPGKPGAGMAAYAEQWRSLCDGASLPQDG